MHIANHCFCKRIMGNQLKAQTFSSHASNINARTHHFKKNPSFFSLVFMGTCFDAIICCRFDLKKSHLQVNTLLPTDHVHHSLLVYQLVNSDKITRDKKPVSKRSPSSFETETGRSTIHIFVITSNEYFIHNCYRI